MDIIDFLFSFQNAFVSSISWNIIETILSSFMLIYLKEIMSSDEKPAKKSIKEKEPKEKKEVKSKKKSIKGGENLHPTIDRMFEPDLLSRLNQIPKASIDAIIEENPLPFGYAILCGFIKETETGYVFSEESLGMIKFSLSNIMNMMDSSHDVDMTKDDWTIVNDSMKAFKFVHTASIHAMVRDGLDRKEEIKGGSLLSKRVPLHKIKSEDMDWLSQQDAAGFKNAKKHGLLKDGRITELGINVFQKTVDQSSSTLDKTWSKMSQKSSSLSSSS